MLFFCVFSVLYIWFGFSAITLDFLFLKFFFFFFPGSRPPPRGGGSMCTVFARDLPVHMEKHCVFALTHGENAWKRLTHGETRRFRDFLGTNLQKFRTSIQKRTDVAQVGEIYRTNTATPIFDSVEKIRQSRFRYHIWFPCICSWTLFSKLQKIT